jgi:hypothetical protein
MRTQEAATTMTNLEYQVIISMRLSLLVNKAVSGVFIAQMKNGGVLVPGAKKDFFFKI